MGTIKVFSDGSLEALTATALLRFALSNDTASTSYDVLTSCEADPADVEAFFQQMQHTRYDGVVLIGNVFTPDMYASLLEATHDKVQLIVLTEDLSYTTEPEAEGWIYYCDNRVAAYRIRGARGYLETLIEALPSTLLVNSGRDSMQLGGGPAELEKILRGSTTWKLRVLNSIYETLDTSSYITWLSERLAAIQRDYHEPLFDTFSAMFADRFLRYQDDMNEAGIRSAYEILPHVVMCTLLIEDSNCFLKLVAQHPHHSILVNILSTGKCYMISSVPTANATRLSLNKKEIWVQEVDLSEVSGASHPNAAGAD